MAAIIVEYSIDHRPEGSFVTIQSNRWDKTEYGPMPRDWVGPFIDEQKEMFEDLVQRSIDRIKAEIDGSRNK